MHSSCEERKIHSEVNLKDNWNSKSETYEVLCRCQTTRCQSRTPSR